MSPLSCVQVPRPDRVVNMFRARLDKRLHSAKARAVRGMFPLLSMGKNRAWRKVSAAREVEEGADGYLVHRADGECSNSVSTVRSKAISALAAKGIDLIDSATWPEVHPVCRPYSNREGAQILVTPDFDQESLQNDVLQCHEVLKTLANENALIKGGHLRNVHVRFPSGAPGWKPPRVGWHVERGAGSGLRCTCILHFTTVSSGGGGVAVVVGSHVFVQRVFSWRTIPRRVKESFAFHVLLGYLVSWAARCGAWEIREVVGSEGDIVQMNPYLVHSPSRNARGKGVRITCQVKVFGRVPSKNQV